MAEQERLTKAERREQARAERRRKEAEEAARAKKRRATSMIVGLAITAFVVWVLWLAFAGGPGDLEGPQVIDPAAADEARQAAGCVAMETDLSGNSTHFAPAESPPADTLYTLRPTASGPHFERQASPGVYGNSLDERATVHSMEHGAIVVWYDPDRVTGDVRSQMADWAELLNANGFAPNPLSGAGMFVAPFEGEFTSGKPIALRGWGAALDCDSWDELIANAFVVDHYGTHGIAPERTFARYPEDVMLFAPGADETESPNGGLNIEPSEPDDHGDGTDTDETDAGDDESTSDEASPEPSPSES